MTDLKRVYDKIDELSRDIKEILSKINMLEVGHGIINQKINTLEQAINQPENITIRVDRLEQRLQIIDKNETKKWQVWLAIIVAIIGAVGSVVANLK